MTAKRTLSRSFAGGEITPELYGRIDLTKFQTGLALCKNMVVLPHGPATCRPGLEYVLQCKDPDTVRLVPFSYNTEQTYIIEVGPYYMRFHTDGATVLDAAQNITSITSAAQALLTYVGADNYANGDWVYIAGTTEDAINTRFAIVSDLNAGANTFKLKDLRGNYIDSSAWGASATGGTVAAVYELTTTYLDTQVFTLNFVQNENTMTIVDQYTGPAELTRTGPATFALTTPVFAPILSPPAGTPTATATIAAGAGTFRNHYYAITAISDATGEESIASAVSTAANNNLTTLGNLNTITWASVSGASRYNVYKLESGLYGYIGQAVGTTFEDWYIQPDFSLVPPTSTNPLVGGGNFPTAVTYYEQRRVFGGTINAPLNYWMTRSGTESNMSKSSPPRADDSLQGKIVAREVNAIRHFIPLSELLVLTSGGEWVVSSSDGGALTGNTFKVRPQSYEGCSQIIPQVTGSSVLFVQAEGHRVFEIQYSWESNAYTASDVSIMAPHLVDDATIVDTAYARGRDQVFWATRSDGVLLGMTYVPKHEVSAWHQHHTDGLFKSVGVVSENNRHATYCVVQRVIDGTTVQYLERIHDRTFTNLEDWFGVDAGKTYSGAAATVISKLWHLEGETVDVLANGAAITGLTVTDGSITLPESTTLAHIGLPYAPVMKPLPVTFQAEAGGLGRVKNINSLYLRVNKSTSVQAGRSLDRLRTYPGRTTEPYGTPPGLLSGEIQIEVDGPWDTDGEMYITREGPLPLTVVSLSAEVEVGG